MSTWDSYVGKLDPLIFYSSVYSEQQTSIAIAYHDGSICSVYKFMCLDSSLAHELFINPRRACAVRVTVVVLSFCLSVCLSVTTFSAATRNKTANKRYE